MSHSLPHSLRKSVSESQSDPATLRSLRETSLRDRESVTEIPQRDSSILGSFDIPPESVSEDECC